MRKIVIVVAGCLMLFAIEAGYTMALGRYQLPGTKAQGPFMALAGELMELAGGGGTGQQTRTP